MSYSLKLVIRQADIFGIEPRFNINATERFTTVKGGILSVLFFGLCLAGIFHFGKELWLKTTPYVVNSTEMGISPTRFNLEQEFIVMIGVGSTTKFLFIDPTIYSITAKIKIERKQFDLSGNQTTGFSEISLRTEVCQQERHFVGFQEQFREVKNNPGYCIHPDDRSKIYLQGSKGDDEYAYLFLTVDKCANNTVPGVVCQSDSVIETILGEGFFTVDYIDTIYDPKNFSDPRSSIRRHYFDTVSKKFFNEYFFYYNTLNFETDKGFLIEDTVTETHMTYDSMSQQLSSKNLVGPYYGMSFRLNNVKNTIFRKYIKIQDVVANVGGLIKGILMIMQFFMMFLSEHDYHSRVINESYVVESKSQHLAPKVHIATSFYNKSSQILENNFMGKELTTSNNMTTIQNNLKPDIESKFKTFSFRKYNFRVNFFKSVYYRLCARNDANYKFFLTARAKFVQNTDIVNYNKLIEEYEFIKNILFDENGKVLLNWLRNNRTPYAQPSVGGFDINRLVECYQSLNDDVISKSFKKQLLNYFE
jgi:hypothetical protein